MIIEVKSTWTLYKELDINLLKKDSVLKKNVKFMFLVFDKDGNDIMTNYD